MDVSIVVVSYRTRELTRDCLASIERETSGVDYEVIVIENASGDGSAEMIGNEFPSVRLFALDENIGFAAACNLGADEASGEFVLLLNPDMVVLDGAVQHLVEFARTFPRAGIYGGRTLRPDGSVDPSSCWNPPTPWSTTCFALGLSSIFKRSPLCDPESLGHWQRDSIREVGMVTGCLLLIRLDLWRQLGGFDRDFFMYGEDTDLNLRAAALGCRPAITPEATVTHYVGASSVDDADKKAMVMTCKAALMRKHWSPATATYGLAMLQLGVAGRAAASRVLERAAGRRPSPWAEVWRRRRQWVAGYRPQP